MDEEDEYHLFCSIANSEGLQTGPKLTKYTPLFKHPLPLSDRRHDFETNLKKILSCKVSFQAMAAISQGDAWSLEEVYMRHGIAVLGQKNGMSPIHLAVQMGYIDCIMVLINMGVDINETNSSGQTPLTIARSCKDEAVEKLLVAHNATIISSKQTDRLDSTILDVVPETNRGTYNPSSHKSLDAAKSFNIVRNANHYY